MEPAGRSGPLARVADIDHSVLPFSRRQDAVSMTQNAHSRTLLSVVVVARTGVLMQGVSVPWADGNHDGISWSPDVVC